MRVCVVQPIVPAYRVPVFSALARVSGIDLEVWADLRRSRKSLKGISHSESFKLRSANHRSLCGVDWQPAALAAVRGGFDVVILGDNIRMPWMWVALAMRRSAIVLWGHGYGTTHPRLGDQFRTLSCRGADAVLLYSEQGRSHVRALGVDEGKLFVAPNAIDQEPIRRAAGRWSESQLCAFQQREGVRDLPILLYLSRLEPEKRPELALKALTIVRERVPGTVLVMIGDGSSRASLERLAERRGLIRAVRFLGAIHDEDRIAPWALSARALVHPGALGLSVLHAYGYGLPAITTDEVAIQMPEADCLIDGVNGLRYSDGDVKSLAACCIRILSDSDLHSRLSRGAANVVGGPNGRNIGAMIAGISAAIQHAVSSFTGRTQSRPQ